MQNLAKKIFAVGLATSTVLLALAPLAAHAAADPEGTNVLKADGTVGMIIGGMFRPYTSAGAFLSYGFNSWSTVVPANADDLALPVGAYIPPQDGKVFCATQTKGTDVAGECSLITGGMKAAFTSAAVFEQQGFSFANAISGDSSFLAKTANVSNGSAAHLPGTLIHFVNSSGNDTVYLVGSSGLLGIPNLPTFNSWGYSFSNAVQGNASDMAMPVSGVMAARVAGQLSPTALAGGTNPSSPVISGNVSASLSSDTPAAGTLVANSNGTSPGQTGADLANFNFTGTGTVTQVVVNRIGVSSDNTISNVYLYQGSTRITSAGSFSNGMVTFSNSNGLFTVNGSMEVSVLVDVAAGSGLSGQTVGAQLGSYTVANGSPMSASISGNLFQIAAVSNLATAQLSGTSTAASGITSSGASNGGTGTINAGTTNAILWQGSVSIGQRTVLLKHVAFTQIGSIQSSAITNYTLVVDGNAVPITPVITNTGGQTQVVFDMPYSPVSLGTGSHTIALQGNIVGGTSFTFEYSLQTAADIVFYDTNYSVNVPLTYSNGSAIFQVVPGLTTISSGTVSVQNDPTFTATQFVGNSSGIILGQWDLTAYGENVNVNQLQVKLAYTSSGGITATSTDGFNNLQILVNGGGVGSSQSAIGLTSSACTALTCTYTFGTTNLFSIPAGTTVTVQVKGDSVYTGTDISAVTASLVIPQYALQGQTSFALSPASTLTYAATQLTTGGSTGTLASNSGYTNQTVGSNQNNQEIGSYVVQAGSVDGIRLNQVTVGLNGSFSGGTSVTNALTNLSVSVTYPGGSASTTPVNPQGSNTFTLSNVTIPANQTATVNVYANIGNYTGTASTTLYGTAQGLTSNQSLSSSGFTSASAVTGQKITVGTGSLTSIALSVAASPQASYVAGGTMNQPVASYTFYATSTAGVTITELGFTFGTSSGAASQVSVDGVTAPVVGSSSLVSGLSIAVPFGSTGVTVPVTVTLSKAGSNGVSDQVVQVTLAHVKYNSGSNTTANSTTGWNTIKSTSDATTTVGTLGINAPAMDLVGSYPSLTVTNTSNGGLALNEQHLIDVVVNANAAGAITASSVQFTISQSGITTATLANPRLAIGSNTITNSSCAATTGAAVTGNTTATTSLASAVTVVCTLPLNYNIQPSSPVTFSLYGTIGGSISGSSGTAAVTTALGAASTFSWLDITGDGSLFTTANTTYFVNYPSQSWYVHN